MSPLRFAPSFLIVLSSACIGRLPQAADKQTARAERGHGNTGIRRSDDPSGLPIPPGPGNVSRPSGAPGNLTILPWAGFKAAVTYTFDDGSSSQTDHYDELQALGVPVTFYLTTGNPQAANPVWARALKDGHELGNHSKSHAQNGRASDIDAASDFIQRTYGVPTWTMASPFGDPSYPPLAGRRFLVNRGVVPGLIGVNDPVDPFDLPAWGPSQEASAGVLNAQVDSARQAGKWRIFLLHGFVGGNDGAYMPIRFADFAANVNHAKSLGDVWIDSMVSIASYWRGQRAVAAAQSTKTGTTTTWTWSLPKNFPPGKYLRVRIDGGTLSQNNQPLPWNPHGYYEIALDAGTLTLSPDAAPAS
jgi:peptidoglycan/xylan/chitin deacetylase (PgdA/CDA1 family)